MNNFNYLHDSSFLRDLDNQKLKTTYTKIIVLNKDELPLETIQGKVSNGSLNLNGSSSVRRTGSITFLAKEENNNLTDVNHLLSLSKRIKIFIGFDNNINPNYDKVIWFPLGVFIITQPSITHSMSGVNITLNFKDKMCLLNGECGGGLPAAVTFHEYDQMDAKGKIVTIRQRIYDIIQTLVCNFGGESIDKIFINDIDLEIKQIVRWTGQKTLYLMTNDSRYTTVEPAETDEYISFNYNEDIGYIYTDFVYPSELVSGIGDNVCSILDKIKNTLGNYEYFYDIEGNFIFQEVKNYLNNSYNAVDEFRLDQDRKVPLNKNGLVILNDVNYAVDFNSSNSSVYTFEEGSGLISSYSNSPIYTNIKNDFHIWGKNADGLAIHYHFAIKEKPIEMNTYQVIFLTNDKGEYTGRLRLATEDEIKQSIYVENKTLMVYNKLAAVNVDVFDTTNLLDVSMTNETMVVSSTEVVNETLGFYTTKVSVNTDVLDMTEETDSFVTGKTLFIYTGDVVPYTPQDWRAELYLRGLRKQQLGLRPDIYEQELLDLFDGIYNFRECAFKTDIVKNPNNLLYFIDYLEPAKELHNYSVDNLNIKMHSYQQDNINKLYPSDVPNYILLEIGSTDQNRWEQRCEDEGQDFSNVAPDVYSYVAIGTTGYVAQDIARELLYQHTNYSESITIQSIPIYYLEPNTRITVNDQASDIYGDYIIDSISLPLDASKGLMNIRAKKALERI